MVAAVPKFHLASATAIAHLAEFDVRRLYVPGGYPSMAAFCVTELGLSEQVAKKLIRVGRTARRVPEIFLALADGRLNATGVIILAPVLTPENAAELLAAAARRSNEEIRDLVTDRCPRLDVPLWVGGAAGPAEVSAQTFEGSFGNAAPGGMGRQVSAQTLPGSIGLTGSGGSCGQVSAQTPVRPAPRPKFAPLGAGRYSPLGRRRRS
jgi:hypothetical protein